MSAQAIFYDPQRKRWKRLRRIFDAVAVALSLVLVFFAYSALKQTQLPELSLTRQKHAYRPLKEKERHHAKARPTGRRKTKRPASQVTLNSGEGIRAAFYVMWDAGSFASLREYVHQIDLLYPEWLHVTNNDGRIEGVTDLNKLFDVVHNGNVEPFDGRVMQLIRDEKSDIDVLPLVNNFDPTTNQWIDISGLLNNSGAREHFRIQLNQFLASDNYKGINLDFESIALKDQPGYRAFVNELYTDLHAKGMKLHISVPVADKDFDYAFLAAHSDGLVLMNYDEHFGGGDPGPIASQDWFTQNLVNAAKVIPRQKIICAVGSYGYDWEIGRKDTAKPPERSVQEAWLDARDSESEVEFDSDSLNPHFSYLDDDSKRHDVWLLDGVTVLNQMRAARALGIQTYALWRLGSEDRSLWQIWDTPGDANAPDKLRTLLPGQDVDMEGSGEILHIASRPEDGERKVVAEASSGLITSQSIVKFPSPYVVNQYGASPSKIAITFDDGPDPEWTPKILDVLKQKNVKATFFVIGMEAQNDPGLTKRIYREGHEIGNHTFTHPDISSINRSYMKLELNMTERLFASRIGAKTILFRPPYSIDQEPDTADQVRPLEVTQAFGLWTIGDKIDPNDWRDEPGRTPQQIADDVFKALPPCGNNHQTCGNIVLLHDGGGNRAKTVAALPLIIDGIRARGFELVPVSGLIGKTRNDVMPPLTTAGEKWSAFVDLLAFDVFHGIQAFIVIVFFIGDILMSGRLLLVGTLAIYDRLRGNRLEKMAPVEFTPDVAILIPAYNEGKVIERTIRAALMSHYPKFRVIVVDDGSKDQTYQIARDAFAAEIASGKVMVLTKPNSGKAESLNHALEFVTEEIFVGIDADTVIARDAVARLVPHFLDPRTGAVAGNAKVGNRVNLWTRWQALEYITSQNFERRALDALGAVSVVPGAIGAWRTAAVRAAGGFHVDTVAEDGDLTMALLENGYRVTYEDRAIAWTEAPISANGLMRQRFRWSFGILQAVYKHRGAFARKGVLGRVALPNIVIFQILLPLVSPFIDIMFVVGLISYGLHKYFHPLTTDPADLQKLIFFFAMFMVIDFIASTIAFLLERREASAKESVWLLGHVWFQRFAYRQLFSIVLVKTLKRAMEGRPFAWDKLERTASLPFAKVEQ